MTSSSETAIPTKKPLYYGWRVLGVTMAIGFFSTVMSQFFTGAMLPHIEEGTGWSRSSITIAVTIATMTGGFLSPTFGHLSDKHGSRWVVGLGIPVVATAMIGIGLSGGVGIVLFYVAYVCGRITSQNVLAGVTAQTTVINWFRRMRGRAVGFVSMSLPLGGATMVPLSLLAIDNGVAWEIIYFSFAALFLIVLLPLAVLVLRRRPEDMGMQPDGDDEPLEGVDAPPQPVEVDWTLKQAIRTRTLWLMVVSMAAAACGNSAISFHMLAYFDDSGVGAGAAALSLSLYALGGAVASGIWGFVIEHVSERLVGTLTLISACLLCLFLLVATSSVGAISFGLMFGLAARGEGSILIAMMAQYFGRGSFGSIQGFTAPFQLVALGLGPTMSAVMYDYFDQSYDIAFITASVIFAVSAVFLWSARKPVLPTATPAQ